MKILRFNESSGVDNNMSFVKNIFMDIDDFCEDNGFSINYNNPVLNNYKIAIRLSNLKTPVIRNVKTAQQIIKFTEAKLEILKKIETLAKRIETNDDIERFESKHNATSWRDSSWTNEDLMTIDINFNTFSKADRIDQILKQTGDHLNWNPMILRRYILNKYGINTYHASCTTEEDDYSDQGLTIEYNKHGEPQVELDPEKVAELSDEIMSTGIFTHFSPLAPYQERNALYFNFNNSIFSADYDGNQRYAYLET